jgi:carbon-monoxide dehydrogenase medium subunit
MRATLPAFDYYAPTTIEEALRLLTRLEGVNVIAGGTDLITAIRLKGHRPANVVSLRKLRDELDYITEEDGVLKVGALTRIRAVERSQLITERAIGLHEAASQIGSIQIRNRATVGGNLCNASPAADLVPPLLVLDSNVRIIGLDGERVVSLRDFFVGPGKTLLKKEEILKEVHFKSPERGTGTSFIKLGRRREEDISIASAAAYVKLAGSKIEEVRIAMGSVAPKPIRAGMAERFLIGKEPTDGLLEEAGVKAMEEAEPITDIRATAEYRKHIVKVLVKFALSKAIMRARGR